jgi:hypothetical protein
VLKIEDKNRLSFFLGAISILWWLGLAYYWSSRGMPEHLFWTCDLALVITGIGLILENSLLISSQFIGAFIIQLGWNIDFLPRFLFNIKTFGYTSYMFSESKPFAERALSMMHVFLPFLLIYGIVKHGYSKDGWKLQSCITFIAYLMSYLMTSEADNTNWVLGPFWKRQEWIDPILYVAILFALTIIMYYLFHILLIKLFRRK